MAPCPLIDRTLLRTQLHTAQRHLDTAQKAQELVNSLELPARGHIKPQTRIGDTPDAQHTTQSTVILITDTDLEWSTNFYTKVFLTGSGTEAQLRDHIAATTMLPGLVETIRAGSGSLLRRLFTPDATRQAEATLTELIERTKAMERHAPAIIQLCSSGSSPTGHWSTTLSRTHPVGQNYIDAARTEIACEVGENTPRFQQWDGAGLNSIRALVQKYATDPNSEFRLRAEAERSLEAINQERVQVLLEQLPVNALHTATSHRLRFGSLKTSGVATLADV